MPFVRRRPLLRAAAVGGVAYMGARAGTNRAMANAQGGAVETSAPAPAAPPPDPAASANAASDRITMLQQLAQLHDSGALTDEEFAAEKAKILG
ncbi:MAG: SHOCT domain-containing protein [Acidimicrobiales bacterium]|nr:SHOCT domain-containing protein [Acidimicrobiales bacterium]